jgi:hypothetical protein
VQCIKYLKTIFWGKKALQNADNFLVETMIVQNLLTKKMVSRYLMHKAAKASLKHCIVHVVQVTQRTNLESEEKGD